LDGEPQAGATADARDADRGDLPEPNTSRRHPGDVVYPYLLRGLAIDRPNQVWCADITYIPLAKGFVYLVAVMDWFSRRVLAWRLSTGMSGFCVAALQDALDRYGSPEIFNTDQGVQFTGAAFAGVLAAGGVRISMDGTGRYLDNIFIERLWRSLKYEDIYIKAYASVPEARRGIGGWLTFTTASVCIRHWVIELRATSSRHRQPVDMWTTPAR
jgi:putative transposase